MFQRFIDKLTGTADDKQQLEQKAFAELNQLAPLSTDSLPGVQDRNTFDLGDEVKRSLMVRETVLGREQRVEGYEFRLNRARRDQVHQVTPTTLRLYDEVLLRNIMLADLDRLLGHRQAFIPLSVYSLNNPLLNQLSQSNVVLMLECTAECSSDFDRFAREVLPRLQELHEAGLGIGMTRYNNNPVLEPFFELADFVLLDMQELPFEQVQKQVQLIQSELIGKQLVARNVDSLEMLHACLKLPFQYFHGPFVMRREKWESRPLDSSRTHILRLLNEVRQQADTEVVAAMFKHDATLTYKLLRFINSPASGLSRQISSIEHALLLLGHKPVYRWLTLLLFVSGDSEPLDDALLEAALIRGRLMELLWCELNDLEVRDELFVTGVFSLLDKLLRVSMEEVLPALNLQGEIEQALLELKGPYAPYLALAMASETDSEAEADRLTAYLGLTPDKVNRYLVDALVWAQDLEVTS